MNHATHVIEVPETISSVVKREGTMDYKPSLGSTLKPVVTLVNHKMTSFFKSGKSLNK